MKMTEINLNIDVDVLREMYFGTENHKYFFGPNTKKQSLLLVTSIFIYPFFVWYSIGLEDDWIFVFGTIAFSLFLYEFLKVAKPIIKWKKEINDYLKSVSMIKVLKFQYSDLYIIHTQDEQISKMEWSKINQAIINDDLICLYYSNGNFLLPKKSMSNSEFETLSKTIFSNVPNVDKN